MSDLERRLRDLPAEAFFPASQDLSVAVEGRLQAGGGHRVDRPRRSPIDVLRTAHPALAAAALAVIVAGAVLAASPDARSAVLEFLGLEGARIERREPSVPAHRDLPLRLGDRVSLAQARSRAGFPVVVPELTALGAPASVHLDRDLGAVSFTWTRRRGLTAPRRARGPALVMTQLGGAVTPFIQKAAGTGTVIEEVRIGREPGYWLEGARHQFAYAGRDGVIRDETTRLAGNTLLWERSGRLLRLEGARSKAAALAIARSAR